MPEKELHFTVGKDVGQVTARLVRPADARWLLVLAHGAGAGINHPFMAGAAASLAAQGIASLRYNFPYLEQGRRSPDPPPVLLATVGSALAAARESAGDLPMLAGGKSLGGRMTSTAASRQSLPGVGGLVFFGFPLHAPGKVSDERGQHLFDVALPMLFLQGSRDRLADLALLRPLCDRLRGRATLHVVEGADHSFQVPKKSGRTGADVLAELARAVADWAAGLSHLPDRPV